MTTLKDRGLSSVRNLSKFSERDAHTVDFADSL
jgi:hypothetical protein